MNHSLLMRIESTIQTSLQVCTRNVRKLLTKNHNMLLVVLVALLTYSFSGLAFATDVPEDRIMAIYFHRTQRCPTCLKMGSYSEEAVTTKYAEQIKDGKVSFHYVDFQDPKNARLAKAYGIDSPALIVAKTANKKVLEFWNLEEIWNKVADKADFVEYVQDNIDTCITPSERVVAMYFHRTKRCSTCLKMGSYSEEAVKKGFTKQYKDSTIGFYYIDFQNKSNADLVKRYSITGPALLLAKVVDNKVVDFKNLTDIWTKVGDKQGFLEYVQENVKPYQETESGSKNSSRTANARAR